MSASHHLNTLYAVERDGQTLNLIAEGRYRKEQPGNPGDPEEAEFLEACTEEGEVISLNLPEIEEVERELLRLGRRMAR